MESVLEIGSIPCPDPIEGAGNLTLVSWAYLVAVVAAAPSGWCVLEITFPNLGRVTILPTF